MTITYKDAGVDIKRGEALVDSIAAKVKSTYGERVVSGVGGFGALYKAGDDRLLAAGADGVGTKLLLAQSLNIHHTVGIDLVAMSINDIICSGARPLFFMDYIATGKIDIKIGDDLIAGMVEGCKVSECALIGGECAEMPGLYEDGEYDLAGFAIGEVDKNKVLGGDKINASQKIIGIPSSGFHSNGYSLVRKLLRRDEKELAKKLLTPTRIYWPEIKRLLEEEAITGAAHITGGGLLNISRLNKNLDYHLKNLPEPSSLSLEMETILERSGLSQHELCRTFNMGIGMVVTTDNPELVQDTLDSLGTESFHLGEVTRGEGRVLLNSIPI